MNIKELVIGGIAGAALALVGSHYFGAAAQATPSSAGAGAATAPTAATAAAAVAAPPSAASAGAGVAPALATAPPAAAVACPPAVAALVPKQAAASAAAPVAALRVDVPAVALSAEHAKLLLSAEEQPPSLSELHARFAGEPLDPAWSQPLEAQLRQALQDAGVPQQGLDLLAVECRRTMCELRLFGNGPDAGRRWGAISTQLTQQPWWTQNVGGMTMSSVDFNGRAVIAAILQRAKH